MSIEVSLEFDKNITREEIHHLMEISGFTLFEVKQDITFAFNEELTMPVYWSIIDANLLRCKIESPQYPPYSFMYFTYADGLTEECTEKINQFMKLVEANSPAHFLLVYEDYSDSILAIRDENGLRFIGSL